MKQLLILANEEELKNSKFYIIFNVAIIGNLGNLQNLSNDEIWKMANELKISLMDVLIESPIYDYDFRIKEIMIDISKIKHKESKSEELLALFNAK